MIKATQPIPQDHTVLIVGLGLTGLSTAQFLRHRGIPFVVVDSHSTPPAYDELLKIDPQAEIYTGEIKEEYLTRIDDIVVSPGVSLKTPAMRRASAAGKNILGDIELFARYVPDKKIVAITGTNGKSTTTTLLASAAKRSGLNIAVGGNLGTPALELIDKHSNVDAYILELSSFQLETTYTLSPSISVILNISADHLDRYQSFGEYRATKLRIHNNSHFIVINREESLPIDIPAGTAHSSFGLDKAAAGHFGVMEADGVRVIACGDDAWVAEHQLTIPGEVGLLNVQAMFVMGQALGLSRDAMIETARSFKGLSHRLQHIGCLDGVDWYDDSKATNVASACAALNAVDSKVVWIGGGDGKRSDFTLLADHLIKQARAAVLLGKDAEIIARAIGGRIPTTLVKDMDEAVRCAKEYAQSGDCVLLSPACASLDMYRDYNARGEAFVTAYRSLC